MFNPDFYDFVELTQIELKTLSEPVNMNDSIISDWISLSSKIIQKEDINKIEEFFNKESLNENLKKIGFNDIHRGLGSFLYKKDNSLNTKLCVHNVSIMNARKKWKHAQCKSAVNKANKFNKKLLPFTTPCKKCFGESGLFYSDKEQVASVVNSFERNEKPEAEDFLVAMKSDLADLIKKHYKEEINLIKKDLLFKSEFVKFSENKKLIKKIESGFDIDTFEGKEKDLIRKTMIKHPMGELTASSIDMNIFLMWNSLSWLQKNLIAFCTTEITQTFLKILFTPTTEELLDVNIERLISSGVSMTRF